LERFLGRNLWAENGPVPNSNMCYIPKFEPIFGAPIWDRDCGFFYGSRRRKNGRPRAGFDYCHHFHHPGTWDDYYYDILLRKMARNVPGWPKLASRWPQAGLGAAPR